MDALILEVSGPMLTLVATGIIVMALVFALAWLGLTIRQPHSISHKRLAPLVLIAVALHGMWGIIAVFVLKS